MTTPPPPPPSSSQWSTPSGQPPPAQPPPAQPPSGQPQSAGAPQGPPGAPTSARSDSGDGGRRKWWSAGRVFAAVVIVLVLMGGSATAGFFAGAAWSGAEAVGQGIVDDLSGDLDAGTGSGDATDGQAVDGDALQVGDTLTGTLDDAPVQHDLTVEEGGAVTIELRSDDFDTVVRLLDANGDELAENDDIELGQNRNSRVEVELTAGSYTVVVDAFGFGQGRYELSVS